MKTIEEIQTLKIEQKRTQRRQRQLLLKSSKLGVEGNLDLAEYIEYMEWRINDLEETVKELYNKI